MVRLRVRLLEERVIQDGKTIIDLEMRVKGLEQRVLQMEKGE